MTVSTVGAVSTYMVQVSMFSNISAVNLVQYNKYSTVNTT